MSNLDPKYKQIFETAVEFATALQDAKEQLRQHMADAAKELTQDVSKEDAKKIKADLAEVKALAIIEAAGAEKRRAVGEKIARRERIAHVVGVQLDLDFDKLSPMTKLTAGLAAVAGVAGTIKAIRETEDRSK